MKTRLPLKFRVKMARRFILLFPYLIFSYINLYKLHKKDPKNGYLGGIFRHNANTPIVRITIQGGWGIDKTLFL